jgi:hypothetical protein
MAPLEFESLEANLMCIQSLVLVCLLFMPSAAPAGDVVVIGGTERQKRFVFCVAEVSANELRVLPDFDQPMTFVILEHQKFLQTRDAFHARTKLAFSHLAIRRIYLSSRVFTYSYLALWCIPHELGHFVAQSKFESPAELAAGRIRWRTRQTCGSALQKLEDSALGR